MDSNLNNENIFGPRWIFIFSSVVLHSSIYLKSSPLLSFYLNLFLALKVPTNKPTTMLWSTHRRFKKKITLHKGKG
jgi:hypothetical protein